MRKLLASALMILCLTLTACGEGEQQIFETTCDRLTAASALAMTAEVQADFGETVEQYRLDYGYDGDVWSVVVTEPAYAAGLTVRISEGGSEVEYDGAVLATGDLLADGVKPIGTVPLLIKMLETGFIDRVWVEGEEIVGHVQYTDTLGANLWLDSTGTPIAAELIEKGIVKAACTLSNVMIEDDANEHEDKADLGRNQPVQPGT